ncbi:MAG: hypothetical protein ABI550_07635, partial [Ignavibacteriaceae bacterium]
MNFKRILISIIILFSLIQIKSFAQYETDSIEVYLIDSYVTPELPHKFILSFFTSAPSKSTVLIDNTFSYPVSDEFTDNHKFEIETDNLNLQKEFIPFIIFVEGENGNKFQSENYEFSIPIKVKVKDESNFLYLCLFAGTVFALPFPTFVIGQDDNYFSLTKEIPLISIRSSAYSYPRGYFSIEYSHIFNALVRNFFRVGYKHLIPVPGIEYISPGINGFTNFNGF